MSMNAASSASHIPEWTVGERLRKAREDRGLSQEALARETSISKRQIIYYENGTKTPTHGEFLLWQMITLVPAVWLKTGGSSVGPTGFDPMTSTVIYGRFGHTTESEVGTIRKAS